MNDKRSFKLKSENQAIAGELSVDAARKQLRESLIPLQWLAQKNGFSSTALLLEEAINEVSSNKETRKP